MILFPARVRAGALRRFLLALLIILGLFPARLDAKVPSDRLARLARGINLSEVLEGNATFGGDPARLDAILATLANAGFTHIRLPIGSGLFVVGSAGYDGKPAVTPTRYTESMTALHGVIDRILAHGLSVTIDMHQDSGPYVQALHCADPAPCAIAEQQLESFWDQAAQDLAGTDPNLVYFELLNEPNMDATNWQSLSMRLIAAVRRHAPHHTLLLSGVGWDSPYELLKMSTYADDNIVYVVHFYEPMEFTHQGAVWQPSLAGLKDIPFPTSLRKRSPYPPFSREDLWDATRIADLFARVAVWGRRHDVPITLNEFGSIANGKLQDRVCWTLATRRAVEQNGISWAFWDFFFPEAFGLVANRVATPSNLNPGLAAALGVEGGEPNFLKACK